LNTFLFKLLKFTSIANMVFKPFNGIKFENLVTELFAQLISSISHF